MGLKEFYKDKVVLVTGSSMGLGKEIARQVLINGGQVVITSRDIHKLNDVEKEFDVWADRIFIKSCDVTNFETVKKVVELTIKRFGRLDVLINNAGISGFGEVELLKPGVARQIVEVNILGSLFPVTVSIPELKKTKGSVLFISSVAGLHGIPGYSLYSLSKMALKGLSQSLSFELKHDGIFVGITFPCFIENESNKLVLNASGGWEKVSIRPKLFTHSRRETAIKILNQIMNKRKSETHSGIGKFTHFLSLYFPSVLRYFLYNSYRKKQV